MDPRSLGIRGNRSRLRLWRGGAAAVLCDITASAQPGVQVKSGTSLTLLVESDLRGEQDSLAATIELRDDTFATLQHQPVQLAITASRAPTQSMVETTDEHGRIVLPLPSSSPTLTIAATYAGNELYGPAHATLDYARPPTSRGSLTQEFEADSDEADSTLMGDPWALGTWLLCVTALVILALKPRRLPQAQSDSPAKSKRWISPPPSAFGFRTRKSQPRNETRFVGQLVDDELGRPIANATINLEGSNGSLARVHSDRQGRFCTDPLSPGMYTLVIEAQGHTRTSVQAEIATADSSALRLQIPLTSFRTALWRNYQRVAAESVAAKSKLHIHWTDTPHEWSRSIRDRKDTRLAAALDAMERGLFSPVPLSEQRLTALCLELAAASKTPRDPNSATH